MTAPPPGRRSLTHVGGDVTLGGEPDTARALGEALDVRPAGDDVDEPERADVHGFHVYPARMHPTTAARLVALAADEGARVLDPFCGSGTVLVEALASRRHSVGTDLNPLAARLSRLKVRALSAEGRALLVAEANRARAVADQRRKLRVGSSTRYPEEDVELFDPHVLLELDSLRVGIDAAEKSTREALMLVLSSLLTKVSRQKGDTSAAHAPRRLAAGYTAKLFARKTEELAERLATLDARVPRPRAEVKVTVDDATALDTVATASVDAVVTSPPYVATYDYASHHVARLRWLGLPQREARRFVERELGSRRAYASRTPREAREAWLGELRALFGALVRVTRPGGRVVLLMADSAVRGEALRADDLVAEATIDVPELEPWARASQSRPHFHGPTAAAFQRAPRREHALLLRRALPR
ncbi:MAG: hypothetical protein IPF92_23865 [Myxococcales bacterium]|nr:hypothetical protein [Myxococcales bacterium]